MFSQWVFKKICKFFLKRLLGRLLRSELDLDQLEVQLGLGTISLKDLHLNKDYLNDQLGDAAVAIKEGIVGSIKAKIPWRVLTDESCVIELEDLKLVVVPRSPNQSGSKDLFAASATDNLGFVDSQDYLPGDADGYSQGPGAGGAYMGVDDGVRMIAQMVERVLLNLHVVVTNLVIVLEEQDVGTNDGDFSKDKDVCISPQRSASYSILVIRVPRLDHGVETAVPEIEDTGKVRDGVEPNMLVKVVKFEGATVEIADVLRERLALVDPGESSTNILPLSYLRKPAKIVDGGIDGMSGTIQLSVPWKDGTVDVPKVHADLMISPLKFKCSPHEIRQLVRLIQAFSSGAGNGVDTDSSVSIVNNSAQSVVSFADLSKSRIQPASAERSRDLYRSYHESSPATGARALEAASSSNSFLPVSRFISNWMYSGASEGQRKEVDVRDADLAASVDEFFECFDGTRSIQQGQGSGLWNWPRSAFSAITAASSLAAGSPPFPDPLKQVEYSVKARVAGISVVLCYDFSTSDSPNVSSSEDAIEEHLSAELSDITFSATVSPYQVDCTTLIKDMDISEVVQLGDSDLVTEAEMQNWQDDRENHLIDTRLLQESIETALPAFPATLASSFVGPPIVSNEEETLNCGRWKPGGMGGFGPHGRSKCAPGKIERKRLLALQSGPDHGARVIVTLESTTKSSFEPIEANCFLQPLVFWLDVRTLKRIELLILRSEDSTGLCTETADINMRGRAVPGRKIDNAGDSAEGCRLNSGNAGNEDIPTIQGSGCPVNIFSSSVRVLVCFPLDTRLNSSSVQENFIGLDLKGPPNRMGVVQPMLVYKQHEEKQTLACAHSGPCLILCLGELAAHLISGDEIPLGSCTAEEKLGFTPKEILSVFEKDPIWGALPTLDRTSEQGISVEFQWNVGRKGGELVTKKTWEGIAAQQMQGDGGRGISGTNSEFAAATTAAEVVEEQNSQLRKELISSSSFVVRVNLPQVKFQLSEPYHTRVLDLFKSFTEALMAGGKKGKSLVETDEPGPLTERISNTTVTPQICVLLQCGQVDMALCLSGQSALPTSKHDAKAWDVISVDIEKLQVLSVSGMEGVSETSYLWVHHEEGQVTGSYLDDVSTGINEKSEKLLLSFKSRAIGRGDGGGGNALASGKAGLTFTYMVWPDQEPAEEPFGSALLTGTIRGSTFVAHSSRLDWLPAVAAFLNPRERAGSFQDTCSESVSGGTAEYKSMDDQSISSAASSQIFFLLDFQDAALCYEPGPEAMMVPGVRAERDALRRGAASSLESSQVFAPVACVLAAAALRVSSSAVLQAKGEQFDIWLRDVALHLLDTTLRKHLSTDYTTASMKRTGYVQIAREAVMEALVRVDGEDGLQWEVECANSQLRFDTCHDTTAAFGRLVSQLQQLFAPELDQTRVNGNNRNFDRRGSSSGSPSTKISKMGANDDMESSVNDASSEINLFDGVLEDAFSRVRSSCSSVVGEDDQLSSGVYTVLNVPLHSRVGSMDRHEVVDKGRKDAYRCFRSSPSTPTPQHHPEISEDPPVLNNAGPPTFIEDYYMTLQKQGSLLGDSFSRQAAESPRASAGPSRGSTSSGGGRETEGKGGWYSGKSLTVLENHVPQESPRSDVDQSGAATREQSSRDGQGPSKVSSLPKKYPSSVGRVVLSDLKAKWRLYGGSDWPTGRTHGQDPMYQPGIEGSGRQLNVCMEVLLNGMMFQYDTFPAVGLYASRVIVNIRDIAVYDDSTDAPWRTVLSYNWSKARPRESSSQAVKVEMNAVRPDPTAPLEEYRLSISLLPISLHLDQRHIDFFIRFFSPHPSTTSEVPAADEGLYPLTDSTTNLGSELSSECNDMADEALLPFFQICEMRPLTIRVDYVPRRVDILSLRTGNYAELLNLVSWKGIELNLKHVRATGVHGWSSLSGVMVGEWLEDISQNQVHKFVKGMGPIRPFYAVGSGAAKLVVLPVEHYKRDRRLFRGMRKGAIAFLRSISLEALGLGAHLAAGAQEILQQTEVALGGTLSPCSFSTENGERRSKAVQPGDTREGLQQARETMSRGLERTASSLVGNPYKVYQRVGAGLAVASALRAAPAAAVAPASAAAGAVHRTFLGIRNELDPDKKRESDEKHSGPPPDRRRSR